MAKTSWSMKRPRKSPVDDRTPWPGALKPWEAIREARSQENDEHADSQEAHEGAPRSRAAERTADDHAWKTQVRKLEAESIVNVTNAAPTLGR